MSLSQEQIDKLKQAELYQLKRKVEEAKTARRDLLKEMAGQIDSQITEARHHLNRIK